MNVIHTLAQLIVPSAPSVAGTQQQIARRLACAEALVEARQRTDEADYSQAPDETGRAAYDAQLRRVRESSYLSAAGRLFQVH